MHVHVNSRSLYLNQSTKSTNIQAQAKQLFYERTLHQTKYVWSLRSLKAYFQIHFYFDIVNIINRRGWENI